MNVIPQHEQEKFVNGIGFNDILLPEVEDRLYYAVWAPMLTRVTNSDRFPAYKGCSVHPDWLSLSKFKEWMKAQKWQGMELDKDLLIPGNKVYGPETCCFIPGWMNAALSLTKRGARLPGVASVKSSKKNPFCASVTVFGEKCFLGMYATEMDAHIAWQKAKSSAFCLMAKRYVDEGGEDERVVKALLRMSGRIDREVKDGAVTKFLSKP